MGVQVAKSAAKTQAIIFALLGVLEFGAFAFGPVQGDVHVGVWERGLGGDTRHRG